MPITLLKYVRFGINFEAYSSYKVSEKPKDLKDIDKDFILSVGTDEHRDIELLDSLAGKINNKTFVLCSCNKEYLKAKYKSNYL